MGTNDRKTLRMKWQSLFIGDSTEEDDMQCGSLAKGDNDGGIGLAPPLLQVKDIWLTYSSPISSESLILQTLQEINGSFVRDLKRKFRNELEGKCQTASTKVECSVAQPH